MNRMHALIASALLVISGQAFASSATYYLDQSNVLPDGVDYASVQVTENAGKLDFIATALAPLNWRFDKFYVNFNTAVTGNVTLSLPTGWNLSADNFNVSTFGLFSDGETTPGNANLKSILTFTASNAGNTLSLASLIANSDGWIFAAHMKCGGSALPCSDVQDETSHFVAGPSAVVPIPAAIWLFGSALLGLAGFGKRNKQGVIAL